MVSLYNRLLKYQQTEAKSNLENFSTEILCDFLNRLAGDDKEQFLRKVIFLGKDTSAFEDFVSNNGEDNLEIIWKTQCPITISETTKYPDLIGFIDDRPAILIEVKIDAKFTQRTYQDDDGNTIHIHQLEDYGNWLSEENDKAIDKAILLLLSRSTRPPSDFLEPGNRYGVAQKNYVTWNQIYRWLNDGTINSKVNCLVEDFKEYLLEQNMAIESPVKNDFSILELWISGAGNRIGNMMTHIRNELQKKHTSNMDWKKEKRYFNNDGELYTLEYDPKIAWSWVHLNSDDYAYIGWGICFPDELDEWGWREVCSTLPTVPFVHIGLFSASQDFVDRYKENANKRPDGWCWNDKIDEWEDDILIGMRFVPLDKFVSFEKDATTEIFNFLDSGFKEISALVSKIV